MSAKANNIHNLSLGVHDRQKILAISLMLSASLVFTLRLSAEVEERWDAPPNSGRTCFRGLCSMYANSRQARVISFWQHRNDFQSIRISTKSLNVGYDGFNQVKRSTFFPRLPIPRPQRRGLHTNEFTWA